MIQTDKLSKSFNNFIAVDQVSLEVRSGEVLALLGPNGAGKTTTLRMLTSVLKPTGGWARVAGYDVVTQPAEVRASVGVLTEQHGLYGRMNALEYLDFFGQIYHMDSATRQVRTAELLEQFGLFEDRRRKIGEYSKGMRQKLALARALIHDPPVLLMDEPTSAMDPESARLVRDAIHGLRSAKRTIIICTHNLAEAEELADKIAIIQHGRIIILGQVEELKNHLLGAAQFEVRLGAAIDLSQLNLPASISLLHHGENWFQYETETPVRANPQVVQYLVNQNVPVMGLAEIPRSLEKVYLQAVGAGENGNHTPGKDASGRIGKGNTHAG
ncbi:MAG: ABC transporter ATP-binding protein [Anaerolineales bacterium]|nr:ABC transporter ATP-binding protein [Anaerolineae bacterium]PWB53510.1 MAG: ABC transporter ATP-binding protein [Anaerolineales bacterium]